MQAHKRFYIFWIAILISTRCHGQISPPSDDRSLAVYPLSENLRTQCLRILRSGLMDEEFWPSIHAAEGLTLAGLGDEVRTVLQPKLVTESDDQRRCGLSRELVRAGDWQRSQIMLDILAGSDPYGHVHAAESLYKVAEVGDGELLRQAMEQTDNGKLQLMAAAALGRCGSLQAIELVRAALVGDDVELRRLAAWILARIGDESDKPQLRMNAAGARESLPRCFYMHALAALGDPDGVAALKRNTSSDDPAIRTYAATFAGDARAVSVAEDLIRLLDDPHLDARLRAAQSLLVMAEPIRQQVVRPPHPAGWSPGRHDDISQLVYEADARHPRYTEGSVIRLADDSLLFAVTQFIGEGKDHSAAQIIARRSYDQGRSWTKPRILQETTGDLNVMSVTLRRLRPAHSHAGKIATGSGHVVALFYLEKNSLDDLRVFVRLSHDDSATFGEPIRVTTEPGYHVMNNDRVTQLASGRILVPVATTPDVKKVNHFVSTCWISDDDGKSWRKGAGEVDLPKRGAMEPEVIELRDGRVMMIMRTQLGYIAKSYSSDGAETWSPPSRLSTLQAPEAPAALRRIPATDDLLLIWNNTYMPEENHGGRRTPLTAAVSSDEGGTWQRIQNIETRSDRSFSYASLIFVKDRAVMSYWEAEDRRLSARFRSLPVHWFYAAKE